MKDYPTFVVDRSRRSETSRFAADFVVCTKPKCTFIARIFKVPNSQFEKFAEYSALVPDFEARFLVRDIAGAKLVLEVLHFFNETGRMYDNLPALMKNAMKAYLFGEAMEIERDFTPYDRQISAVEEVLRLLKSQWPRIVDMSGERSAREFLKNITAVKGSLELLKKITKNE